MRPRAAWLLAAAGGAVVILAAREHAWALGHWSQDLSPVPLLAGLALLSPALGEIGWIGSAAGAEGTFLAEGESARRWHLIGAAVTAVGLALLGRSGLALVLAALIYAPLVLIYAPRPRRAAS